MKARWKYILAFILSFLASAIVHIQLLGSGPSRLLAVDFKGQIIENLPYANDDGHQYDLYLPSNKSKLQSVPLILFIHGGSFNSGSKEDGKVWAQYLAQKGFIVASVDYSLFNQQADASLPKMLAEIVQAIKDVKVYLEKEQDIIVTQMAASGVSAGGTLALNFAYSGLSPIPVKFVFQLSAPIYFEAEQWSLLMKVNGWQDEVTFYENMTGLPFDAANKQSLIDLISPSAKVVNNPVPTLFGHGQIDSAVPIKQAEYLLQSLEAVGVPYDYVHFPKSNHGMYNDLDQLQVFMDMVGVYADKYFE